MWHQGSEENMKKLFRDSIERVTLTKMPESRLQEEKGAAGGWEAPIWRLGVLNLNGRIYPESLADKIIGENKTTVAYDGHNADAFSEYEAVKAIAKNPRKVVNPAGITELWVDIIILDATYEAQLQKLMSYGIPIGVSSVGWGETDANGLVVTATYELVRYLDFVLTPAGEVYAEPKTEEGQQEPEGKKQEEEGEPVGKPEDLEASKRLRADVVRELRLNNLLRRNK